MISLCCCCVVVPGSAGLAQIKCYLAGVVALLRVVAVPARTGKLGGRGPRVPGTRVPGGTRGTKICKPLWVKTKNLVSEARRKFEIDYANPGRVPGYPGRAISPLIETTAE
eukprot:2335306-Rhodomonas_salina.1